MKYAAMIRPFSVHDASDTKPCAGRAVDCAMMHAAVSELAQALSLSSWSQDPQIAAQLLACVRSIRQDLQQHTAATEGAGGWIDDIGSRCPHLTRSLEKLSREHDVLDEQLADLESRLQRHPAADPSELRFIRQSARNLLSAVRQHEDRGNSLMLDAYCTDTGVAE